MSRFYCGLVVTLLALAVPPAPADETVEVHFTDASLPEVLDWASRMADPPIGLSYKKEVEDVKINYSRPDPLPRTRILGVVRTILRQNGFVLIERTADPAGKRDHEVVRDGMGRWQPPRQVTLEELASADDSEYVRAIVILRHADAREVQGALKLARMSHPQLGNIVGVESTQALVIDDYADQVRGLVEMVEKLDAPRPTLSMSVRTWLYRGTPFSEVPGTNQGEKARAVLADAERRSGEALLVASSGRVVSRQPEDWPQSSTAKADGVEIKLVVQAATSGAQLELRIAAESGSAIGAIVLDETFAFSPASPGDVAFVRVQGRGEEALTLVVHAIVETE